MKSDFLLLKSFSFLVEKNAKIVSNRTMICKKWFFVDKVSYLKF